MPDPVVVNSTLHRAFTTTYAVYILTAILAAFALPPSLEAIAGTAVAQFWFFGLGVTALFSLVFSLKETWQRKEMISTSLLVAFLVCYSGAILWNGIKNELPDLLVVGMFTLSFSVMPSWRVFFFFTKFRNPRG